MSALTPLSLDDYDAIAAAVMETERGRWFLAEFARRNRSADTAAVLEALAAVEARLGVRADARSEEPAGAASATLAMRSAAELAVRLREILAEAGPDRRPEDAARCCEDLERIVARALEALGAERTTREPTALAAPPETGAPQDLWADQEFDFKAERLRERESVHAAGPSEASLATEAGGPAPIELAPLRLDVGDGNEASPIPKAALVVNGETIDLTEGLLKPPSPIPPPVPRPVMPKAWTPGLLDSLSEEEKAILFA